MCRGNVAPFEIASRKDNCASRCCNKLMTVLTMKSGCTYSEFKKKKKTDDFSSRGAARNSASEIKREGVCDTK